MLFLLFVSRFWFSVYFSVYCLVNASSGINHTFHFLSLCSFSPFLIALVSFSSFSLTLPPVFVCCFLCFWIPTCVPLKLQVCTSFGFLYSSLVCFVFRPQSVSVSFVTCFLDFWVFYGSQLTLLKLTFCPVTCLPHCVLPLGSLFSLVCVHITPHI